MIGFGFGIGVGGCFGEVMMMYVCVCWAVSTCSFMEHQKQYAELETAQTLKLWLMDMFHTNSDGWVPNEAWESVRKANKAAFELWMESAAKSGELDAQKARALWPSEEM